MSQVPVWIEYLSAFLTPTIAVTTAFIALQQYFLARSKYRFDLYERRSKVFSETQLFIKDAVLSANNTTDRLKGFQDKTIDRYFLFGAEINKHIDQIEEYTENLALLNLRCSQERERGNQEIEDSFSKEFMDLSIKCTELYNGGNIEVFRPYLNIKVK